MTTVVSGSYPAVNSDSDATINGLTVGRGAGAVATNTAVGASALAGNSTGIRVTALGTQALQNNTASENTALGARAMLTNTSGANNTAVGRDSMYFNTTGGENSALGLNSLVANTTGSNNTAIGRDALQANTTASNNTAVGYQAGYTGTTGTGSVYLGQGAGYSATSSYNTIVGREAGYNVSSGGYNTFLGQSAGYYVTTGAKNTVIGQYNGNQGGLDIRTSSNNIVLSDGDGNPRASCSNVGSWSFGNSTLNGGGINVSYDGNSYAGANFVDNSAGATTHNAVLFYRVSTNTGYIQITGTTTSYGSASDHRIKENIVDAPSAISEINKIKVRSFDFISDKSSVKYGFIAQELHQVAPDAVLIGTDKEDGSMEIPWGIDASKLVPYLVKAIQELNAKVTALEAQLGAK